MTINDAEPDDSEREAEHRRKQEIREARAEEQRRPRGLWEGDEPFLPYLRHSDALSQ